MRHINIYGWFDFSELYQRVVNNATDNSTFIEIGTHLGKSAAFMAEAIENSGKQIKFITYDNFSVDLSKYNSIIPPLNQMEVTTRRNLQDWINKGLVQIVVADANLEASNFEDESVDFVFIDGNHDYIEVIKNINNLHFLN